MPVMLLGVDAVEIKKVKAFYARHRHRLASFFSQEEISYIRRNRKTCENLAMILTSKEAAFKALGKSCWMGPWGFKSKMTSKNPLKFTFIKTKKVVVAQCVGI